MARKKDPVTEVTRKSNGTSDLMGPRQMALMAEVHLKLFRQIEQINHTWAESIKRTHEAEAAFAQRVVNCNDPAKAGELCAEWLTSRAATFLAESQRFTDMWLSFYSEAAKDALSGGISIASAASTSRTEPKSQAD